MLATAISYALRTEGKVIGQHGGEFFGGFPLTHIQLSIATAIALFMAPSEQSRPAPTPQSHPTRLALLCFGNGEQSGGMTKVCFYNCNGSPAAITIGSAQLCPLTIQR